MTYDPDPRKKITRDFHQAVLHAYHTYAHIISDDEAADLLIILNAYSLQRRATRHEFYRAQDILRNIHYRS